MNRTNRALALLAVAGTLATGGAALADDDATYKVTITNLTRGQFFTPFLVVSHKPGVQLFTPGEAASDELESLAEGGDTAPFVAALAGNPYVGDVATGDGVLPPGQSVSLSVAADDGFTRVSLAAMLVPTNDAFVALNGVRAPKGKRSGAFLALAYDAGTEANDESCDSIPGPPFVCPGGAESPEGEGYVHVHAGIHGIGNLDDAQRDWRNPVARVIIRRADHD